MKKLQWLSLPCIALAVLLLTIASLMLQPRTSAWAGDAKKLGKPWKEIYALKPIPMGEKDDKIRKLLVERYNEIAAELKTVIDLKASAEPHPWYDEGLVDVSRRLFRTGLDFDNPAEKKGVLSEVVEQVKELEQKFESLSRTLKDSRTRVQLSRFKSLRLEIEFHIAREEK